MGINNQNHLSSIKQHNSLVGAVAGVSSNADEADKKLAKYINTSQQLLLVLLVLSELSAAAGREQGDGGRTLAGYLRLSEIQNSITADFRVMETTLQSMTGSSDPDSTKDPKDPIINPTIKNLLAIYYTTNAPVKYYVAVYQWEKKFEEWKVGVSEGKHYAPNDPNFDVKNMTKTTLINNTNVISDDFLWLTLSQLKVYRANQEKKEGFLSTQQERAQAKGQTNINNSFQIQSDYSQMTSILKKTVTTLSTFK